MNLLQIDHHPPRRKLVEFGVVWLVFFGVLGGIACYRNGLSWAAGLWGLALAVPAVGWAYPAFMRLVYVGMQYLGLPVRFVVSIAILAIVYYAVLTPVGLLMRVLGYDPMKRRFDPAAQSYWVLRQPAGGNDRYFQQY